MQLSETSSNFGILTKIVDFQQNPYKIDEIYNDYTDSESIHSQKEAEEIGRKQQTESGCHA